ncbi:MAG: CPBP family intramembrane metalloprotease [Nitrososphaerota archaeon]|nr:CPBP family intramembrane metalloprotease [Nitrososphaerota archaeon]MDG7023226.1 CPBP family intramembrane metalloprotease [Nitrososphaerota archaeon]
MTAEEEGPPDAGVVSKLATSVFLILFGITLAFVIMSFPAGLYAVFHGGLSTQLSYGSLVNTYLWIGPVPAWFPFTVPVGGLFVVLTAVYAGLFLFGALQPRSAVQAVREAFRTGIGALTSSPFIVMLVAIGFLRFSLDTIAEVSSAIAGPVGNPFSSYDLLLEFGSLTFAPLREELGFRLVLIGVVAFILCMGKPVRQALKALWRPSAAYEGALVGGATSVIIWLATVASAATFGLCHVNCGGSGGYNWSYFPAAAWGGLVLGYLYVKYGLHVAILTHWGIDYFGSVYSFFGQSAYGIQANSATTVYIGQYVVDFDMYFLFGVACFILVVYLGVKRLAGRRRAASFGFVDKGLPGGGGLKP